MIGVKLNEVIQKIRNRQDQNQEKKYDSIQLNILKSIVECNSRENKESTVEKVFAQVKNLLEVESDITRIFGLCGLLSSLSSHISLLFYQQYFDSLSKFYKTLLNRYNENSYVIFHCLELFSNFLEKFQNDHEWNNSKKELFALGIFQFYKDDNHKIRNGSIDIITKFLEFRKRTVTLFISDLFSKELQSVNNGDYRNIIRLISINLLNFPTNFLINLFKMFLNKLIHIRQYQDAIFKIFNKFFLHERILIPKEHVIEMLKALLLKHNFPNNGHYVYMIKNGFLRLQKLDYQIYYDNLKPLFVKFVSNYKTTISENVSSIITDCLKELVRETLKLPIFIEDAFAKKEKSCLWKMIQSVRAGLKFFNNLVYFPQLLEIFQEFLISLQVKSFPVMNFLIRELTTLYNNSSSPVILKSIEKTLGIAMTIMGPRHFFSIVPFNTYFNYEDMSVLKKNPNFENFWIMKIMLNNIQNTELALFTNFFLPLSQKIFKKAQQCENQPGSKFDHFVYSKLSYQLWGLFPRFCIVPVDVNPFLGKLMPTIILALKKGGDYSIIALKGIIKLIKSYKEIVDTVKIPPFCFKASVEYSRDALTYIATFTKGLLVPLFEIFKANSVNKQIVGNCISSLFSISQPDVITYYFKSIVHMLLQKQEKGDYEIMDLTVSIIPHLPLKSVEMLFKMIKSQISEKGNEKESKKSYRALLQLSKCFPNFIRTKEKEIFKILLDNIKIYNPCLTKFRFKIILTLLKVVDFSAVNNKREIVCESILGTMANNSDTRVYSREILNVLILKYVNVDANLEEQKFQNWSNSQKQNFLGFFKILYSGFGGKSSIMVSGTINSFTYLCKLYYDVLFYHLGNPTTTVVITPEEQNLNKIFISCFKNILKLMKLNSPDVFSSCLYFIKMIIKKLPINLLKRFVPEIVTSMIIQLEKFSAGNRRLVVKLILEKLVRNFGYEHIRNLFTSSNLNLKIIKSVKVSLKTKKRKKKNKSKARVPNYTMKVQVREGDTEGDPINFYDPRALANIKMTQLNENEYMKTEGKKERFQINSSLDDKLIIKEITGRKRRKEISEIDAKIPDYDGPLSKKIKISENLADELDNIGKGQQYIKNKQRQRKKAQQFSRINFGQNYRSGDGRSDKKILGKPDPYAYIPLDPSTMNRRNRFKPTAFDKYKNLVHKKRNIKK